MHTNRLPRSHGIFMSSQSDKFLVVQVVCQNLGMRIDVVVMGCAYVRSKQETREAVREGYNSYRQTIRVNVVSA